MNARVLTAIFVLLATATVAQSKSWFAHEVSCWITQEKVPASWEDAQRSCERHGAILASPLNTQLFHYMQFRISVHNHSTAYFIGTRAKRSDDGQEVQFVSVEGRRLDNLPMDVFDVIEQLDLEQGDCLSMDRHGIRAVSCWDHLPYICYSNETTECGLAPATTPTPTTSAPTTTTSAPLPTSTIPPGYTFKSTTGSFYKFHHQNPVTWHSANATCVSEGANLVVLNNAEEANIIRDIIKDAIDEYYCTWTGLRDNRPGGVMDWRTVHGESVSEVFHEWYGSRPINDAAKTCSIYCGSTKRLYDYSCDYTHYDYDLYFICEISQ